MQKEDLYFEIINNINDGIYFVNQERKIEFWNKAAEEISGYKAEEVIGQNCGENLLNHIDSEGKPLCIVGCPLYATMIDGEQRKTEVFFRHKDGHRVPVFVNIFPIKKDGKIVGAIEIFTPHSPVVYKDDLVEQLSNMAMSDSLTGLPNRRYLQSFLEFKANEHKRFHSQFAVMFMDIDDFRSFNNTYGHDAGDEVLKRIAETLKKNTRKTDLFGRWGGEEFLGIYTIKEPKDLLIIAEKVRMLVANTQIVYDNQPLFVTASIGITSFKEGDSIELLFERSDQLMYMSKTTGKNKSTTN